MSIESLTYFYIFETINTRKVSGHVYATCRGIDSASFFDFCFGFWNFPDSAVFLFVHVIAPLTSTVVVGVKRLKA
jgi:hypothetical protein